MDNSFVPRSVFIDNYPFGLARFPVSDMYTERTYILHTKDPRGISTTETTVPRLYAILCGTSQRRSRLPGYIRRVCLWLFQRALSYGFAYPAPRKLNEI